MSLAANALSTVARVKDAAAVPCSDARVEFVIGEVSAAIESYTGRKLGFTTVSTGAPDYYKGNGTCELWMRRLPVLTITRVRVHGTQITDYLRMANLDEAGCILRGSAYDATAQWTMTGAVWPDLTNDISTRDDVRAYNIDVCGTFGFVLPQYSGAVNATHNPTGGSATLPLDLEGACIREVLRRIYRPIPGVKSEKTPGSWEMEWQDTSNLYGFSDETVAALNRYVMHSRFLA